ncbi:unnamed protein product [Hydatigera taeniaeformis]|uniref:Uncharacterized protein n=1 Tax=Hydatigena taeniaeformis TaxID=6205 RepID=A0A0R3WQV6_HYDTA|nr:unnamed protein product [Hydatigera taeniaeformis]
MGNDWSTRTKSEKKQVLSSHSYCKWYKNGTTSRIPSFLAPNPFPQYVTNPTFPEFDPTLFLVDIGAKDVNLNNLMKKKKQTNIATSRLFIYGPNKIRYLLQFRAANAEFSFVYAKDRPAAECQKTRSSQTHGIEKFVKINEGILNRNFYRKEFIPTSNQPKKFTREHIHQCDENLESQIFVEKDGMEFLISIRGDLTAASQFKYEAPSNYLGSCRASLLIRIDSEGDVCRVCFDLVDVNYGNILSKTSRGCQTTDPYIYYKTRGITNSFIYVPVPLSTYLYRDPMPGIRLHSHKQLMRGVEPEWMTEVRRKRLCHPKKVKADPRYPGSLVSSFIVEYGGYAYKACTGLLRARLIRGTQLYDEFVRTHFSEGEKFPEKFYDLPDNSSFLRL